MIGAKLNWTKSEFVLCVISKAIADSFSNIGKIGVGVEVIYFSAIWF